MFARVRSLIGLRFVPSINKTQNFGPTYVAGGNRYACDAANTNKVVHDPVRKEFRIDCDNNNRAFLQYEMEEDLIRIIHTEVPEPLGGKGYAKELAKAALSHIEKHHYQVQSHCSFFSHYVKTKEPRFLNYFKKLSKLS